MDILLSSEGEIRLEKKTRGQKVLLNPVRLKLNISNSSIQPGVKHPLETTAKHPKGSQSTLGLTKVEKIGDPLHHPQ